MGQEQSNDCTEGTVHRLVTEYRKHFGEEVPPEEVQLAFRPQQYHDPETAERIQWIVEQIDPSMLVHCLVSNAEMTVTHHPLDRDDSGLLWWLQTGREQYSNLQLTESDRLKRTANLPEGSHWYTQCSGERLVYRIAQGTDVYHVSPGDVTGQQILERMNYFGDRDMAYHHFARDYIQRHPHGANVHRFQLTQDIALLAMDQPCVVGWLRHTIEDRHILQLLERAHPLSAADNTVWRAYGSKVDVPIMKHVCERLNRWYPNGTLHGTASQQVQDVRKFHGPPVPPEMLLCDPAKVLRFVGTEHYPPVGLVQKRDTD